jgi:hypothetical protein
MLGSAPLDALIGLVLIYIVLSAICSAVTEWMTNWRMLRETLMYETVTGLLGEDVADAFFKHGIIRGIGQEQKKKKEEGSSCNFLLQVYRNFIRLCFWLKKYIHKTTLKGPGEDSAQLSDELANVSSMTGGLFAQTVMQMYKSNAPIPQASRTGDDHQHKFERLVKESRIAQIMGQPISE